MRSTKKFVQNHSGHLQLQTTRFKSLAIFSRYGIPEAVISDNGPQLAVVMRKFNCQQEKGDERSYLVRTSFGVQRRNRLHLRWRSQPERQHPPQVTSLLPSYADRSPRSHQEAPEDTCLRSDRRSCSLDGPGNTKTSLPLTMSSDSSPSLHRTLKESTS